MQITKEILKSNGFKDIYEDGSAYTYKDWSDENYRAVTIDLTHPKACVIVNSNTGQRYEGPITDVETLQFLANLFDIKLTVAPQETLPKHSYFEQVYHVGQEPRWKVGDTLAIYEFYSDYEGEDVLGEVTNVMLDESGEDWQYTFNDGEILYESELINEEAYRKN